MISSWYSAKLTKKHGKVGGCSKLKFIASICGRFLFGFERIGEFQVECSGIFELLFCVCMYSPFLFCRFLKSKNERVITTYSAWTQIDTYVKIGSYTSDM